MDFPPLIGGIANYYRQRVRQVVDTGKTVVVLMNKSEIYDLRFKIYDFKLIYKHFFWRFIWPHWLPLVWHIYKIAKKEKIKRLWAGQILPVGTAVWLICKIMNLFSHCHPHKSEDLVVQGDSPRILRGGNDIIYFVTCHGNDLLRAKKNKRKFLLAKKILKDAEFVEANTEFTKNILINDFKVQPEKIRIVYPVNTLKKEMVDPQKVAELKEKYNLANKKVLLTVARLVESKGIDRVLESLPKVWQKIPDLVYLIIGDGPDKNRLIKIANELLPPPPANRREAPPSKGGDDVAGTFQIKSVDRVIFAGSVPHQDLPNYYELADAFIMTPRRRGSGTSPSTDTESFGVVFLEAQEFNLPIITSDVGGIKESLQNYFKANFVNPENIDDLVDNIIKVLEK